DLALDRDLDLLADHQPAVQDHAEAQPEVLPVDLGGRAVRDPVPHHSRVVELAVPRDVERDRVGGVLDGQVTGQRVVVPAGRRDACALEVDGRVLLDLEEVRGAQVVVSDRVVGADARGGDGGLDRGRLRVLGIDVAAGGDLVELPTDGHHPQVLRGELDLCVVRVELPGSHGDPLFYLVALIPPRPGS